MDANELRDFLIKYQSKQIKWTVLAEALLEAVDKKIKIDGTYISREMVMRLTKAYRLIKEEGWHKDPRLGKLSIHVIFYVPFVRNKLLSEGRAKEYEAFKKQLLEEGFTKWGIINYSKQLQNKLPEVSNNAETPESSNFDVRTLKKKVEDLTDYLLENKKHNVHFRKHLSKSCNDLGSLLHCIVNEEFEKEYSKRKEYSL
jgi:hypothetical protein